MSIELMDIEGNPFLGVYLRVSEAILLHPPGLQGDRLEKMVDTLEVEPVGTTIGGSTVIGSLVSMNSKGMVVSNMTGEKELEAMPDDLEVLRAPDRLNACGNNILCNDAGALVHPEYSDDMVEDIARVLDVEVKRGEVAGMKTVGSAGVAVNRGILCHPKATDEEMDIIRDLFKTNVQIGTANYGSAMVGACMVANSKGAVVGTPSTGIEIGRVEDALGYLD